MKGLLTLRKSLLAGVLLSLSGLASAQSFGAARGAVLLGRPLEITVPAQFERSDADDRCTEAQVFYGEARVDASQVSTQLRRTARGDAIAVHARTPVNEPMVTVVVRAGCRNSSSRGFTLLAEPAPDPELLPARQSAVPVRSAGAGTAQAMVPVSAPATAARPAAPRRSLERGEAAAPRDRLKMATRLDALPVEDHARRAAAAMLWRALSAQPQDLQRTLHTLRGLESELAVLRTSAARRQGEPALPSEQPAPRVPAPPTAERDSASLIPLLGALLLAAALLEAWRRRRDQRAATLPWYSSAHDANAAGPAPAAAGAAAAKAASVAPPAAAHIPPPRAAAAAVSAPRVEALRAVLQEVEFLDSLGLLGDAIDTLRGYLDDVDHPPPMAYCELLRLCAFNHDRLGVATVRSRWQEAYAVPAPSFEEVDEPTGLETQAALLARITAAWPSKRALEIIEAELFAVPGPAPRLSLQGWRDLLWLHGMAQALLGAEADSAPADASRMSWNGEVREPGAVDLDVGAAPQRSSVVLQEEAVAAAVSELVASRPQPRAQPLQTEASSPYEDLFDAVVAAEGKWAHRAP